MDAESTVTNRSSSVCRRPPREKRISDIHPGAGGVAVKAPSNIRSRYSRLDVEQPVQVCPLAGDKEPRGYAALSQEDQGIARMILTDLQEGRVDLDEDKTFRDYLNEYKADKQDIHVELLHTATGIPIAMIRQMLTLSDGTKDTLYAFNRFSDLKDAVDENVFRHWLKNMKGLELDGFLQTYAAEQLLLEYFLKGGFDPADWDAS